MSFTDLNGYLLKQSRQGRWQRRYFEASSHYLTYYKSDKKEKLLGCIDLWRTEEIVNNADDTEQLEFLVRIGETSYILKAETTEEAELWIDGLQARQNRPESTPSEVFSVRSEQLDMESDMSSDFGQQVYPTNNCIQQQVKASSIGGSSGGHSSCSSLSNPHGSGGKLSYTDSAENPIVPNAIAIAQRYPQLLKFSDLDRNSNMPSDGILHPPCCAPTCVLM